MFDGIMAPVTQISRGAMLCAVVAGIVAGFAYTVSPSTGVVAVCLTLLFYWAQRGHTNGERRWLFGLLGTGLLVRCGILVWFFYYGDSRDALPVLVGDEWLIKWRGLLAVQRALGRGLAPSDVYNMFEAYGRTSLMDIFAYWQLWLGRAPYGVHLLNLTFWYLGAVALYRASRRSFGTLPALGGLAILLYMPTLIIWSVSALKEPIYFCLTALAIAGSARLWTASSLVGRTLGVAVALVATVSIGPVRSIALFVTAGGLAIAVFGWLATRRTWLALATAALMLLAGHRVLQRPDVQGQIMKAYRMASTAHLGNVRTDGYAYHLLDDRFYAYQGYDDPTLTITPDEAARFTVRAFVSFFVEPVPWRAASVASVAFLPQQMSWYLLALLAAPGVLAGWRRDSAFTWLLVGNIIVGAATVALFNGNVGTFVRFRDSVVTIICWLSALGGCAVVEWAARHFSREVLDGPA